MAATATDAGEIAIELPAAADAGRSSAAANAKYDLTQKLAPFLDVHLMFPMFHFLQQQRMYPDRDIQQAMLDLVSGTNMLDFSIGVYQQLNNTKAVPAEMAEKKEEVIRLYDEAEDACDALLELIDNGDGEPTPECHELCSANKFTPSYLAEHHEVTPECIAGLYACAKFKYECGEYNIAANYLFHYGLLVSEDSDEALKALWGKLASEILSEHWNEALMDLNKLKAAIDKSYKPALEKLQMRSWLLHWSLFVFFNHPKGRDGLVDFFLENIDTVQNNCPWLLRYLAAAVITNKRRRAVVATVVKAIREEDYTYSDPVTRFLQKLLVRFDFDGAQAQLLECESVLLSDYFLSAFSAEGEFVSEFMENARMFIFETYCRIHRRIDLGMLAAKLNMSSDDAERWVVELIRVASLNAKIDCSENHVLMKVQYPSIYQRVINKTKDLSFRSFMLANGLERAMWESNKRKNQKKGDGGRDRRGGDRRR